MLGTQYYDKFERNAKGGRHKRQARKKKRHEEVEGEERRRRGERRDRANTGLTTGTWKEGEKRYSHGQGKGRRRESVRRGDYAVWHREEVWHAV